MPHLLVPVLVPVLAPVLALAGSLLSDPPPIGRSQELLTAKVPTERFELRYRPGARAGAGADRIAWLVEQEYAAVLERLAIRGKVDESLPFWIFLYDDVEELTLVSGVDGSAGFAAGRQLHLPYDNDQTRMHELVHVVVAALEPTGDEPRNMFFVEGLANAVLRHVHGVPVHAVAAYELERGSLPPLREIAEHPDFYAYLSEHAGFNGYDVGGSFMLFLLEEHGPKRVMEFYTGKARAKTLRASWEKLDEAWRAMLAEYPLRPELRTLLAQRRGDGGAFGTFADVIGEEAGWTSLHGQLAARDAVGAWTLAADAATAKNPSGADWSIAEAPLELGDCVLRAKVRTVGSCWGVQLRWGDRLQAMLLGQGAFVYRDEGGVAFTERVRLAPNAEHDLVLRVRAGRAEIWLDGTPLLEAEAPQAASARPGVGLVGGEAEFRDVRVRRL